MYGKQRLNTACRPSCKGRKWIQYPNPVMPYQSHKCGTLGVLSTGLHDAFSNNKSQSTPIQRRPDRNKKRRRRSGNNSTPTSFVWWRTALTGDRCGSQANKKAAGACTVRCGLDGRLDRTYLSADALLPGSLPAPTGPALRWAIRKLTIKNASPFTVYASAEESGFCAVRYCSTRSHTLSNVNGREITMSHCSAMLPF